MSGRGGLRPAPLLRCSCLLRISYGIAPLGVGRLQLLILEAYVMLGGAALMEVHAGAVCTVVRQQLLSPLILPVLTNIVVDTHSQ